MPLPRFADLPYLTLRFIRRTCFPTAIPRAISALLPGFRSNCGTHSSASVVNLYDQYLAPKLGAAWPSGRKVLEVGIGATNSSCYELAARGADLAVAFEPFVPLDAPRDAALLAECAQRHHLGADAASGKVQRLTKLADVPDGSIDLVLSNSVLEHVGDIDALARELRRVLAPGGAMLHLVDYRDHFFKYPYHHLLWSDAVWDRWLNPGDLPRWRIRDHIDAFQRQGLRSEIVRASPVAAEFAKVRSRIHPRFAGYDEAALATAFGVLFVTEASSNPVILSEAKNH
jgi:SAM-dependent methyltransferase